MSGRLNRFSLSALSTPSRWWPRLTRLPLALEITLALLLKILVLTLLWKFFFAHPQAKKMRLPLPQVEQHLLTPAAPPAPPFAAPAPAAAPTISQISKTTDKGSP
ncbi:MAG: cytochrome oxidase putative small subunit CydP [Pseudomonadota bacterium]